MTIEDQLREKNLLLEARVLSLENEVRSLTTKLGLRSRGTDKTPKCRVNKMRRQAVFALTNGMCFYCEKNPATSMDHIKPRSMGGTNHIWNLIGACQNCNHKRENSPITPAEEARAWELHRKAGHIHEHQNHPAANQG